MSITFEYGTQNLTEGPVTDALRRCEILSVQEVNQTLFKRQMKETHGVFCPVRDPHQALAWDRDLIKVTRRGWTEFHRSGDENKWDGKAGRPFIKSPPRGMAWVEGHYRDHPEQDIAIFSIWLMNSWLPMERDEWTRAWPSSRPRCTPPTCCA